MGTGHWYLRDNNCGCLNGAALLGLASITGGALALVTTLLAKQQIEKKKLKPELALKLK
jgi:hypothetical protein